MGRGGGQREGTVSEPRCTAPGEGGSTPPPLARLPGRCGGAGPAARRRDVTVAAAVVGAGSAAAKCELRRARAGGGVKSGSGEGEGRGQDRGRSWCLHPSPARAGSRCWLQLCFFAPLCSVFAPLLLRCPPHPPPRTLSSGPNCLGYAGVPPPTWRVLPSLAPREPGARWSSLTVAAAAAAPSRRRPRRSVGVGEA